MLLALLDLLIYQERKMTNEEIQRFSEQDEIKALILAIVFGALGLFIFLAIVFWPLGGYQLWKYFKIKEAKKLSGDGTHS